MTSTVDAVLRALSGEPSEDPTRRWAPFGLLQNPFPSRAQPIWDVLYNQDTVQKRFVRELSDFAKTPEQNNRTLLFTGGNRVGKTHFMEHHRRFVLPQLVPHGIVVPTALVSADAVDPTVIIGRALGEIDESLRASVGTGIVDEIDSAALSDLNDMSDVRRVLTAVSRSGALAPDAKRWFRGEKLPIRTRRELGAVDHLDALGPVLTAFEAVTLYIKSKFNGRGGRPRAPGVLVFLDEFELAWNSRRDRRDRFLQGLRALLDSNAARGGLFLCVGLATGLGIEIADVESAYPALFERLRGADQIPALTQVGGVVDALGYANSFLEYGRSKFRAANPSAIDVPAILGNREIEQAFVSLGGRSVAQGALFDALHNLAERIASTRAR